MLVGLGGFADVEHGLSRTRTAGGRSPPRPEGSIWADPGPPPRHTSRTKPSSAATETLVEIGRSYNISTATISRLSEEDR
jgi:hypothetical protein